MAAAATFNGNTSAGQPPVDEALSGSRPADVGVAFIETLLSSVRVAAVNAVPELPDRAGARRENYVLHVSADRSGRNLEQPRGTHAAPATHRRHHITRAATTPFVQRVHPHPPTANAQRNRHIVWTGIGRELR